MLGRGEFWRACVVDLAVWKCVGGAGYVVIGLGFLLVWVEAVGFF
jgi:hypothetical protein